MPEPHETETITVADATAMRVEYVRDAEKFCEFHGTNTVHLSDTKKGAIAQGGPDKDGWSPVYRFRDIKSDDLKVRSKRPDPNSPAVVAWDTTATAQTIQAK